MNRRIVSAFVFAAVIAALAGVVRPAESQTGASPPNVVVIETDDQTLESLRVMTQTKRLIGQSGATFTRAFVSIPQCCPSRATFLTGQFVHNHGVLSNDSNKGGGFQALNSNDTLAVWLRGAGYDTTLVGKYLNEWGVHTDPTVVPPGWTDWHALTDIIYQSGFPIYDNGKRTNIAAGKYQTDVLTSRATKAIKETATDPRPLFLWLAYVAPHTSGEQDVEDVPKSDPSWTLTPVPAPRHIDRFDAAQLPMPPSFNETDASDKPAKIYNVAVGSASPITAAEQQGITHRYRQTLESQLAVDQGVAQIVQTLAGIGELNNTYLIFTSDNGFMNGEHRIRGGKLVPYEESVRVPLLIRGPGIPAGAKVTRNVSHTDLAATISAIGGAVPGHPLDGRSLLPLIAEPQIPWNEDLLIEGPELSWSATRTPEYLYVEHRTGERELYDLTTDPYQLQSLHNDPAYDGLQQSLADRLATLKSCSGDSCY